MHALLSLDEGSMRNKWPMAPTPRGAHGAHSLVSSFPLLPRVGWKLPGPSTNQVLALITRGRSLSVLSFSVSASVLQLMAHDVRECLWGGRSIGLSHRRWYLVNACELVVKDCLITKKKLKSYCSKVDKELQKTVWPFFITSLHWEVWLCSLWWLHYQSIILIFTPGGGFVWESRLIWLDSSPGT